MITTGVTVETEQSVFVESYVTIAAGGSLTIEAGAALLIWNGDTGGYKEAVAVKSANYTLAADDEFVVFTATATATLPEATGSGQRFRIANESTSGGVVTIAPDGTDTIKRELSQVLYSGEDLIITDYAVGKWA